MYQEEEVIKKQYELSKQYEDNINLVSKFKRDEFNTFTEEVCCYLLLQTEVNHIKQYITLNTQIETQTQLLELGQKRMRILITNRIEN